MSNLTNANSNNAYFITKNNIIETTNNLLYKMVGYHSLINMNIEDFWKLIKLEKHNKYYKITSRSSKVTEVYINEYDLLNVDECLYIFNVKKNYEFEGCSKVLNQLFSDKINGIGIFSLPDLNLIECNKMYLDFLDEPYNSIKSPIGESIFEIISDFEGSSLYEVWENTIETKKSTSLKSIQFFDSEKDCIVYWDMLIAPVDIFDESYLCVIIVDVTENMSNKFQLEQQSLTINKQNRKLEAIIEAMSGCINIIDNKGNFTKKSSLLEDFFEFDENNKIKYELSEFYDINENPISYENNIIYQLLSGNEIIDYKQILKNKDITKYAMVNGKPIFDESGDFEMGVFITNDITEIITQGKIIEEQSKKAQVIIDNISDGLYIVDNNFNITLLNNSAKDIFYEADAIKKLSDSFKHTRYYDMENKLISLEDMPEYRALRGAKVSDYRITAHRPEGKYNFSFSGSPIYDEKGKITMAIICCRDITRKVRSEEVINVQKEQLEKVLDNISEELYIWNSQGEYIMLNKHAQKRVDSWNTKNIFAILNERDFYDLSGNEVDKSTYSFSKIKDGKEIQDLIVATYDPFKKYLCINIKPILDINNNVNIGILTIEDITNDILYQQSVERQATLLYQIIYNLDLPLLRLSYPDFKIIDINQKEFIVLKELESKVNSIIDIKSKNINEVCPNFMDNENYQYINKCAEEKKPSYLNNVKYIMNNKEKNFNLIFEPILALNGEVKEIIIIMIDITSEIKANLEMKSLLKLQDEFLANISHELKTPLNVIFSSAQLFNMYCKKGSLEENRPSMVKYLSSITQNCYRLSKLISNIVDASKIDAGFYELNKSNYNIVSVVEEIVMSVVDYSKSRALNIVFDTNVEEKIIAFDAEKIERVILNLLSNAIKFSNENDDIFVDIIDKGDFIEISVSDTGTGIDKHHLGIIFDRFKQADNSLVRNAQGSGIGLNLVKSIVDLHGGRIFVESEIGEGSRFTFILPAVLTQEDNNKANKKFNGNNQTISIELSDTLCM